MQSNTENSNWFTETEKQQAQEIMLNHRISDVVKALMKMKGIKTKKEFSKAIGVSSAYVSKVLSSDKYFNVPFLVKLQNYFGTQFTFNAKSLEEDIIDGYLKNYYEIENGKSSSKMVKVETEASTKKHDYEEINNTFDYPLWQKN